VFFRRRGLGGISTLRLADRALALESEASLHEHLKATDTESLYQQAQDNYRLAGDSLSVARIWEWKATQAVVGRDYDSAADAYRNARERYRIAGDTIEFVPKRVICGTLISDNPRPLGG
jgi:hypothetical protein